MFKNKPYPDANRYVANPAMCGQRDLPDELMQHAQEYESKISDADDAHPQRARCRERKAPLSDDSESSAGTSRPTQHNRKPDNLDKTSFEIQAARPTSATRPPATLDLACNNTTSCSCNLAYITLPTG